MNTRIPAQVLPPGDFVREEMEIRGWTQEELAEVMGRPRRLVNELISGKKELTPETAQDLGEAFGTGPEVWMNLESAYRLSLVRRDTEEIARRAKLYTYAPVKDMIKRQWIDGGNGIDALECELKTFFDVPSLDEKPQLPFAARKSATYDGITAEQFAWTARVKNLGKAAHAVQFEQQAFEDGMTKLRQLIANEADVSRVPQLLAGIGVRLVVVEPLPRSRMDGVTLWLNETAPVVGLSIRLDRIDHFWYTLCHELSHVRHGDAAIDEGLVGEGRLPTAQKPACEQRADREASEFLISGKDIESFILRMGPLDYRTKIVQFANRIRVHPGIIVGQLQWRGEIKFSQHRDTLVKVRNLLTKSALTDGWGCAPPGR